MGGTEAGWRPGYSAVGIVGKRAFIQGKPFYESHLAALGRYLRGGKGFAYR